MLVPPDLAHSPVNEQGLRPFCSRFHVQVVEVVLHDPLYKWAMTYAKAKRAQRDEEPGDAPGARRLLHACYLSRGRGHAEVEVTLLFVWGEPGDAPGARRLLRACHLSRGRGHAQVEVTLLCLRGEAGDAPGALCLFRACRARRCGGASAVWQGRPATRQAHAAAAPRAAAHAARRA